jgi:D-alanyl-D-alanine carboxypeptidase/D-alanyl-D-alanine-endopeptidase (penicillin-binding protein 4)
VARLALASLLVVAGCTHAPPSVAPKPNPRAERALAADLDRVFNAPVMEQGLWGVEVKSLDTGRVIYARNPRTLMMPASNMKILTLAAAAETLGWDYRFRTTLETSGTVENGVLRGDLVIRGTGDPTINTRDDRARAVFDRWADAIKAAGISRISGAIVGDDRAFDRVGLGQGWAWDYLQDGYAAPVGALQVNEDIAKLRLWAGERPGAPVFVELAAGAGLVVNNQSTTGEPGSATTIGVDRRWAMRELTLDIHGSLAVDAAAITRDVAVVDPTDYFLGVARQALADRGIDLTAITLRVGQRQPDPTAPPPRVLVETLSPPLRDIATTMMKVSQNLYAETLLKAVGAAKSGGQGTAEAGIAAARDIFAAWHVAPGTYIQVDGSGLSRYDYVTADMLVTLLDHLYKDARHRDDFVATLPIAGKDGTIATRLKRTHAEANVTAKTGSISNARALSGYVRTRDGETLAFSILANSFPIPAATVNYIADVAVERLANHSSR